MSASAESWNIIGQGLAGTCLAWALRQRGASFNLLDRESGGSSKIAAGMINPITGKNFEPSWRIAEFLPAALQFYRVIEAELGITLWHPMPILRLASSEKEWAKITSKLAHPEVAPWIIGEVPAPENCHGAVQLKNGGWLDTALFLDQSREFFRRQGCYEKSDTISNKKTSSIIYCEGASGLISNRYGSHRCAKGEILTVTAHDWDESCIRIGAGGWLVPQGHGIFRIGSTYEWNDLDEKPTDLGRAKIEQIASRLGGPSFQITHHVASIRPILRRSQPLIGPIADGSWMFNALGSKGSLYAPGIATRLARWLLEDVPAEPEIDFRNFPATQI